MRLDRFLWFARLARTRSVAQQIAEAGTLRLDGRRIDRAHTPVRVGSVLAFIQSGQIRILRIAVLPVRRGPCVGSCHALCQSCRRGCGGSR